MRDCCMDEKNLKRVSEDKDKVVRECLVCKARHYTLKAEPGHIGARF
jgi:hypothetical protein